MSIDREWKESLTRRHFFSRTSRGLGGIALASLINENLFAGAASTRDPRKKA